MVAAMPFSPADSARTASAMYTISLAAVVPLLIAMVAAFATRRMPAGTRALIWKGGVTALVAIYAGQQLPAHWSAWIMPAVMAQPLVALGRAQVAQRSGAGAMWVQIVVAIYWLGVFCVISPLLWRVMRGARQTAKVPRRWLTLLEEARQEVRFEGCVRLLRTNAGTVPQTWGVFRPTIALPMYMRSWSDARLRAVLLHELSHLRRRDPLFVLAARVVCALYWF